MQTRARLSVIITDIPEDDQDKLLWRFQAFVKGIEGIHEDAEVVETMISFGTIPDKKSLPPEVEGDA